MKPDETPRKQKSESIENLRKEETPIKQKSESIENLRKKETPMRQKSEANENLRKEETPKRQTSESLENLKIGGPTNTNEPVRLERPLEQKESSIKLPEKREEPVLLMKPAVHVGREKENDKNLVNEKTSGRKESVNQEEEEAHFIRRCDSKVIYSEYYSVTFYDSFQLDYFEKKKYPKTRRIVSEMNHVYF